MESFTYEHFPAQLSSVHVALFTDVSNAAAIRARIVHASTLEGAAGDVERDAVNFAFIEAKLVTSKFALLTAVYQSMLADVQQALKTKTVHSEIIWALNPTNNITEGLRRFGVGDKSTALLVVRVGPPSQAELVEKQMRAAVEGRLVPFETLSMITDWSTIKKYYKFNVDPAVKLVERQPAQQRAVVDELVTSFVAMKSVMS